MFHCRAYKIPLFAKIAITIQKKHHQFGHNNHQDQKQNCAKASSCAKARMLLIGSYRCFALASADGLPRQLPMFCIGISACRGVHALLRNCLDIAGCISSFGLCASTLGFYPKKLIWALGFNEWLTLILDVLLEVRIWAEAILKIRTKPIFYVGAKDQIRLSKGIGFWRENSVDTAKPQNFRYQRRPTLQQSFFRNKNWA